MRHVEIVETVDHDYMILVNGVQWGGERDRSGAGNATFPTREDAIGVFRDCGNDDPIADEDAR